MWSTPKSCRYLMPDRLLDHAEPHVAPAHLRRHEVVGRATSRWRSYWRSARSIAAGTQPMPPSDQTSLMSGNSRGTGCIIMLIDASAAPANAPTRTSRSSASPGRDRAPVPELSRCACTRGGRPPRTVPAPDPSATDRGTTAGRAGRCSRRSTAPWRPCRRNAGSPRRPSVGSQSWQITIGTNMSGSAAHHSSMMKSFHARTQCVGQLLVLEAGEQGAAEAGQGREVDAGVDALSTRRSLARCAGS